MPETILGETGYGYKQPVKERSRRLLWGHAVSALTIEREQTRIIQTDAVEGAWDYCESILRRARISDGLDREALSAWLEFAGDRYGQRQPSTLRVAYLCGPEPENDMRVLADLGVRIENVWAIEQDREAHGAALERARSTFPALKIFHGGFEQFIRVVRERFDVVYLDFTAPLPSASSKPYRTLHTVFDEQVLENLAVLVVNVGDLAPDEGSVQFLADYFRHQPFIESNALGYCNESDPDALWYADVAPDQWSGQDDLRKDIEQRIGLFYSAFCAQYPSLYANRVQPALPVLGRQWRAKYMAKSTNMYLDVHVYDQCRPLYDYLPALQLFPEHFSRLERQFIARIGMSAIGGAGTWSRARFVLGKCAR